MEIEYLNGRSVLGLTLSSNEKEIDSILLYLKMILPEEDGYIPMTFFKGKNGFLFIFSDGLFNQIQGERKRYILYRMQKFFTTSETFPFLGNSFQKEFRYAVNSSTVIKYSYSDVLKILKRFKNLEVIKDFTNLYKLI